MNQSLCASLRVPKAAPKRLLKSVLHFGIATLIVGCGGGDDSTSPPPSAGPLAPAPAPTVAPASLTYATNIALYMQGEAITANTAVVTGGAATRFTVSPALPTGLSLDATNGSISGTPTVLKGLNTYTFTASNSVGSTQAQVRFSVTGRGSWAASADMPVGSHYAASVKLSNGTVLVAGGYATSTETSQTSIYNPSTNVWTTAGALAQPRNGHTATLMSDGRVLVTGGSANNVTLSSAEIYDPASNVWTPASSMHVPRDNHTTTLLPNGDILAVGGLDSYAVISMTDTAEIYSPASNTWTLLNTKLSLPRTQHTVQLLSGGTHVLVMGGVNRSGFATTAEIFPVADTGATTTVGTIPNSNVYASALLDDGSVLAVPEGTTAMRYYPSTNTWESSVRHTNATRIMPIVQKLQDGRVLVAGGSNTSSAEIYNPDHNTWTEASSMLGARRSAKFNLLNDGSVLVMGGISSATLQSVEKFTP